jgi:hypothetical protein
MAAAWPAARESASLGSAARTPGAGRAGAGSGPGPSLWVVSAIVQASINVDVMAITLRVFAFMVPPEAGARRGRHSPSRPRSRGR